MLAAHHIHKSFGIETVLKDISFNLSPGERLGLVGPNGSGKTTLLRILAGLEPPDSGSAQISPPGLSLGYLAQGFTFPAGETLESFLRRMEGDLPALTARIEQLAGDLATTPARGDLQQEYDQVLQRMQTVSESAGNGPAVLAALGLGHIPLETPVDHLSGGQKTRLALAGVLLANPQVLLLDEPTNHLDLEMLAWLEDWLTTFPERKNSAALVVSHDRAFLDRIATGILEIDLQNHTLKAYSGNYTAYLEEKLAERERQWQSYSDQQDEISRLRSAAERVRGNAAFKRGGKGDSGDKFAKGFFANRTLETVRRAKQLEARLERLLTDERIEKPHQSWQMKLDFGAVPDSSRSVVSMEDLSVGYGSHVLLSGLNLQIRYGARIALIGPNGTGKTTLLSTIAGKLDPLGGRLRLGPSVRPGYMTQEQEELDPQLDAIQTVRRLAPLNETDARSFLHLFLFAGDDVFTPVGSLSFGERARLSLAGLVVSGCNFLMLDEPINHLDIPSRSRFEQALAAFEGTVLAVVHDRYFIEGFASEIWEIQDQGIQKYEK